MQNHERKSGMGKALAVAGGIALLAGAASADLRYVNGYSYVYPNNPPESGDFIAKLKRFPIGDSLITGIGPTDGFYRFDAHNLSGGPISIGETLTVECYNSNNPGQKASLAVVVDTLPHTFRVPSTILHNTDKVGQEPFCVSGNVRDTSNMPGTLKVAFWASKDTAYDSVPPFRGNDQYDSLRIPPELLADGVKDGETLHFILYKGELSDTTSVLTDSSIVVNRHLGSLENDVAWLRKGIIFPKTVLAHDGGLDAILAPTGKVDSGKTVIPQSLVRNHGEVTSIIPVYFSILDSIGREIYRDSAETERLAPESTQVVSFREWNAVRGLYGNFIQRQKYKTYTAGKDGKVEVVPETNLILPKSYVESEIASGRAQVLPETGSMMARSWTNIAGDRDHSNDTAEVNLEVTGVQEYNPTQKPRHKSLQSPCSEAVLERYVQENYGKVEVRDVSGRIVNVGAYSDLHSGAYFLRYLDKLDKAKPTEKFILQK